MPSIINASTSGAGGVITTADASGELQLQTAATTALTISASQVVTLANALPAASGGTGLTSPGTSGNVLTSNGTAWVSQALPAGGVTSLNGQTGAITNTDYGAIGSYVVAFGAAGTAYNAGATAAGSSLARYAFGAGFFGGFNNAIGSSSTDNSSVISQNAGGVLTSLSLSGTWRAMTQSQGTPTSTSRHLHLWVRIS